MILKMLQGVGKYRNKLKKNQIQKMYYWRMYSWIVHESQGSLGFKIKKGKWSPLFLCSRLNFVLHDVHPTSNSILSISGSILWLENASWIFVTVFSQICFLSIRFYIHLFSMSLLVHNCRAGTIHIVYIAFCLYIPSPLQRWVFNKCWKNEPLSCQVEHLRTVHKQFVLIWMTITKGNTECKSKSYNWKGYDFQRVWKIRYMHGSIWVNCKSFAFQDYYLWDK